MERTAAAIPTSRLVRIHRNEPGFQVRLGERALSIAGGALEILELGQQAHMTHAVRADRYRRATGSN